MIQEALARAQPFSVSIVGYGRSFIYRQSVLCYLYLNTIHVLDVRRPESEKVFDWDYLGELFGRFRITITEILHFQDDIMTFEYTNGVGSQILCFNVNSSAIELGEGFAPQLSLVPSASKSFIRNNYKYVVHGEYRGHTAGGRHEWILISHDLENHSASGELQLQNFFGIDTGQTVVFEIFDGNLYAVSSQSTQQVEEIDWSSFYHCYRVPVDDFRQELLQSRRIWRRQHREGPINDTWTDLSLQKEDTTDMVTIVETRQEFLNGGSEQTRSFYFHRLDFDEAISEAATTSGFPASHPSNPALGHHFGPLPANDVLVSALDRTNKPQYAPAKPRAPCDVHIDYNRDENGLLLRRRRPSQSMYRTYSINTSSSLDLILDDTIMRLGRAQFRLQLGSRIPASPIDPSTGRLYPPLLDTKGVPIPDSINRYSSRPTRLFPPPHAPPQLFELMSPALQPLNSSNVQAAFDGSILVYMDGQQDTQSGHAITIVNFDPAIKFRGLPKLDMRPGRQRTGEEQQRVVEEVQARDRWARQWAAEWADRKAEGGRRAWFSEEVAAWREIGLGFEMIW